MGCKESKTIQLMKTNQVQPKCDNSLFSEPVKVPAANDANYDNRNPIDIRQAFKIKQSWKGIRRNMCDTGVDMFLRLFKTNSELKDLFEGFKEINTDDELRSNEALEYHATLVMTTLDDAITHIDDYDFIQRLLRKTGCSHNNFKGFEPDNFTAIKEPFLSAVKVTLGDRYTENMENIYNIAISFILGELKTGIQEAQNKSAQGAGCPVKNGV